MKAQQVSLAMLMVYWKGFVLPQNAEPALVPMMTFEDSAGSEDNVVGTAVVD